MSSVYEPWSPIVGQRVRVRISAECRADHPPADGVLGVITEVGDAEDDLLNDPEPMVQAYHGHRYGVRFDVPVWDPHERRPIAWDLYAAVELESA